MKECKFETKFDSPKKNLVRCKRDGTIRNRKKSCMTCQKFEPTLAFRIFGRYWVWKWTRQELKK